ncbi:general substrate transporter [Sphaerosporella brunnea]|uniref:General substrate transporter n=1 Tax=Sphaerosporella brunnea TaxID=1250544 RepID=A0A5J5EPS6_9PEZI|nr:general substrate transporter [Sphaerosporella brunnea]
MASKAIPVPAVASPAVSNPLITELAQKDTRRWYQKPNLRALYLLMLPGCLGVEYTSGFDSSMMNGIQTISYWEDYFKTPSGARLGILTASYSLGSLVALPLVPTINERWGRKMAIYVGSVLMIIGAVLQGANTMFVISRIILGYGIPFAIVGASSLIGELAHPRERPIMTSLFNVSWFVGAIVAAGINLGTYDINSNWSWRIPSYLQFVPSITQVLALWAIPESPRFLVSKDKYEEARAILVKYHAEGDENSELVAAEMAQIQATIEIELEGKKMGWRQYFTTAANRKRAVLALCIGVFAQWSGNNPLSFYLKKILDQVGIKNRREQNIVNLGMTCWQLVSGTVAALIVRRFRRRSTFMSSITGMFFVYIALTVSSSQYALHGKKGSGIATVTAIFCYTPFYNLAFNALTYTYIVEIFPFTIRAKGLTMQQFWGRAATFINTFVNPIGLDNIGWRYYIWYCVWLVCEGIIIWWIYPETSNRTLEELAFLFEGQDAQDEANARVGKGLAQHHEHVVLSGAEERNISSKV